MPAPTPPPLIRPGRSDDLLACTAVWRSTVDPALPPPTEAYPLYGHELDTGTLMVAEDGSGRVIGFGASITRDQRWFLADLFVDPDRHGSGAGRALLDALVDHDRPGPHRATMASRDPRALSLYSRLGLVPRWPCFYLTAHALRPDPVQGRNLVVNEIGQSELLALTRASGYRLYDADLRYWAADGMLSLVAVGPGPTGDAPLALAAVRWATPFAVDQPRAVSLGPVVLTPPSGGGAGTDPADVLAALLRWVDDHDRRADGAPVRVYVPGSHPWLNPALGSGFHITDFDLFCASDPALFDPTLACPSHDLL